MDETTSLTTEQAAAQITRHDLSWSGHLGEAASVTYGFLATNDGRDFTQDEMAVTEDLVQLWSDVANIKFNFVINAPVQIGFVNYKDPITKVTGDTTGDPSNGHLTAGLNLTYKVALVNELDQGQQGRDTLLHEIGHAIGLEHPGDYNAGTKATYTAYIQDSKQYTVMSYNPETKTGADFHGVYASTPLLDDIAAAQRLYGANYNTRATDTVYGFDSNAGPQYYIAAGDPDSVDHKTPDHVVFSIWDGGGDNDTLNFDGYSTWQYINLAPNSFSSVGGLVNNVSIAGGDARAIIENAIGGSGKDTIYGNDVGNKLVGNDGIDHLYGLLGNDILYGGSGADHLEGGGDFDFLDGGTGADYLDGGDQIDTASYRDADSMVIADLMFMGSNKGDAKGDTYVSIEDLQGSVYGDHLGGNNEVNEFWGDGGRDYISGRGGNDILHGGDGNDTLEGGPDGDALYGDDGIDTATYKGATSAVMADLMWSGTSNDGEAAGDTYNSIENLQGSAFGDQLSGDDNPNEIWGEGGIDILSGRGGADTLHGGSEDDVLEGGPDGDTLYGDEGIDTATYMSATAGVVADLASWWLNQGEAAGDTYISIENLHGSLFGDRLSGNGLDNELWGNPGDDTLFGRGGNDILHGGGDNDTLDGGADDDQLDGGSGYDILRGGADNDQYFLTDYAVVPGTVENRYDQVVEDVGGGIDTVHVRAVDYKFFGGTFTTTSYALPDNVENAVIEGDKPFNVVGNDLQNTINGNLYKNFIDGRGGADTMAGGAGDDTYYVDDVGDRVIEHQLERVPHGSVSGGTDTIVSSVDYRALPDFVENLTLRDGSNAHSAIGNALKNTIIGNSADNLINGGGDNDTMTGAQGADTFVFARGDGKDTITDFKIGEDHIDLHLAGVTSLNAKAITQNQAGDAVITYDDAGDKITLHGVTKGQVLSNMASIFEFAQAPGETFDGTAAWGTTVTGTAGADTLTYATQKAGVYVDLVRDGGFSELAQIEADGSRLHGHMTGIENVTGATDYMNGLLGDDQDNVLTGGNSVNWFDGRGGNNTLIGGASTDYADYADSPGPVTIDLSVGKAYHGGYVDTLVSIESFRGSYNSDTFIGSKGNDDYNDLGGHDTIYGNEGDDVLDGYAGDIIDGGAGKDRLGASSGDDLMTGGSEADTFVFRDGSLGRHEVTDFNPNEGDRISFSDYTVPLDLRFGDDGHGNAMITYATRFGDATIVLDQVEPNAVHSHPEWFI